VVEVLLTDLLPDTITFNLGQHHVSTFFAPYADIAPLRWEAITILQDLTHHRTQVPDMVAELVMLVKRNHVIQQERKRLFDFASDVSLQESVVHFLQAMTSAGDSQLWKLLVDIGIPERTIHSYFSAPEQPNRSWRLWRQKHCARPSPAVDALGSQARQATIEPDEHDSWREKTGPADVVSRSRREPSKRAIASARHRKEPQAVVGLEIAPQKMAELLDKIGPDVAAIRAVFQSYLKGGAQTCGGSDVMKVLLDCGVEEELSDLRRRLAPLGVTSNTKVSFATFLMCYATAVGLDHPTQGDEASFVRTEPGIWATVPANVRTRLVKAFSSFADSRSRLMHPSLLVDALRFLGVEAHPVLVERYTERDGRSLSLEDFSRAFSDISKHMAEDSTGERSASDSASDDAGLKRVFDRFDLNGDGEIDGLELRRFFERGGGEVDEATVRRWIELRDRSGTGTVNFGDFATFYRSARSSRTAGD
jgi:Ca2+-binding EF-hand superfamily protein